MSRRTWNLMLAVFQYAASAVAFVLMWLALRHYDYARATFDLLLVYGANWQADRSLDRADKS